MLAMYDSDAVGSLRVALGRALDRPDATWPALVAATGLTDVEREALVRRDPAALDALARTLNELRTIPPPPS